MPINADNRSCSKSKKVIGRLLGMHLKHMPNDREKKQTELFKVFFNSFTLNNSHRIISNEVGNEKKQVFDDPVLISSNG